MATGSFAGALIRGSGKYKIPQLEKVDTQKSGATAIAANLANLPKLTELASLVNAASTEELMKAIEAQFPGYGELLNKSQEVISGQLSGELSPDIRRQLRNNAAERGISMGTSGSEFQVHDELRNLGLTSLDLQNRGMDSASRWMAMAQSRTQTFDFTNMFVSTSEQIGLDERNAMNQFQRKLMKNKMNAMPDAWQLALANIFDNIEELGQSALGGMMGGMGGGGGGGGMMSMMGGGGGGGGGSSPSTPQYNFGGGGGFGGGDF